MFGHACFADKSSSIFVLKSEHVSELKTFLTEAEKEKCCIHIYKNGFLIFFKDLSSWTTSLLFLEHKHIFHQKFYLTKQ